MKPARGKTPVKKSSKTTNISAKDPVEVYCRLRPLENANDVPSIRYVNEKLIQLDPPDVPLGARNVSKQIQYTFQYVFDANTSQKELFDHVSLPLITDLVAGKPGLLFTYGITSSGKTYTMTGNPQDGGVLPRCLDVLFNTVGDFQARKYVFKPDKLNGFDVQSTEDAMAELHTEILPQTPKTPKARRREEIFPEWTSRVADTTKLDCADPDQAYAVFISYIEIYNNYVYDLLEDAPIDPVRPKSIQSKMIREDSKHCMYAFGVTEVEVKSANEAFEAWCKGQRRKRVAHTALNTESSRSHSVFNIRLVQAPLDSRGSEILQDKENVIVSQLSLVDLAGSERTVRTRNTGSRLREAGNINNSLMVLRACLEVLRENQMQGANKMVPYRDTKLTHLFKNFFEGEGKIRMIVCVNPRADDYDETLHVMRFAEMAQEVLVSRSTTVTTPSSNLGLRSGRGNVYREAVRKAEELGVDIQELLPPPTPPPTIHVELKVPDYVASDSSNEQIFTRLEEYLNRRIAAASVNKNEYERRRDEIRSQIVQIEEENRTLKDQQRVLRMDLKGRVQQVSLLEKKLANAEAAVQALQLEVEEYARTKRNLENELGEREMLINKGHMEKEQLRYEMQDCIAFERDKMRRVMERLLADKQAELESKMSLTDEKFRLLREILNSADWGRIGDNFPSEPFPSAPPSSAVTTRSRSSRVSEGEGTRRINHAISDPKLNTGGEVMSKGVPVCNPRHRRTRSSNYETWLEHKPTTNLDTGTVLQPTMKRKKSVSKLDVKDVTKNASKYVLTHQEQDSEGDIETQLYKGDVIPSIAGGAQVVFSEVETVNQLSPTSSRLRKRSSHEPVQVDVEAKCAVAIEGHPYSSVVKRYRSNH